jgi:hypothetical protein
MENTIKINDIAFNLVTLHDGSIGLATKNVFEKFVNRFPVSPLSPDDASTRFDNSAAHDAVHDNLKIDGKKVKIISVVQSYNGYELLVVEFSYKSQPPSSSIISESQISATYELCRELSTVRSVIRYIEPDLVVCDVNPSITTALGINNACTCETLLVDPRDTNQNGFVERTTAYSGVAVKCFAYSKPWAKTTIFKAVQDHRISVPKKIERCLSVDATDSDSLFTALCSAMYGFYQFLLKAEKSYR